ncbi:DNA-binding protein [Streptomyces sp. NPDC001046]|uniref:DNA-binding protein n=1 Tax=Streptomyces sp. NPDC001046 TaxID=3364543 RepID=UPI00369B8924
MADAADTAVAAGVAGETGATGGDLPAGIGRPAARALAAVGLTALDRVAGHSAADLPALHGVGPKAVRVLAQALRERGLAFRE